MKAHIELLMMDLKAHASTTEIHYSHDNQEEIAVVTKGQAYVELEGTEYFLMKEMWYAFHQMLNTDS